MMAFSDEVIRKAWNRSGGCCECRRKSHNHYYVRCNKNLSFKYRGRTGWRCWEAHHKVVTKGDILSNCEILCWECHSKTF